MTIAQRYERDREDSAIGRDPEDETLCSCGHEEDLHRKTGKRPCVVTRCPCEKYVEP